MLERSCLPVVANLGCGSTISPRLVNVDFRSLNPDVRIANLLKGLPFAEGSLDGTYSSHVLEHFDRDSASQFIGEQYRVLRPGGTIRVVVPDLEAMCNEYIKQLGLLRLEGTEESKIRYEYATLDILDQFARASSGGEKKRFLSKLANQTHYIKWRSGGARETFLKSYTVDHTRKVIEMFFNRRLPMRRFVMYCINVFRTQVCRVLVSFVGGREMKKAFDEGAFRATGEVHRWMYDEESLTYLLKGAGFVMVTRESEKTTRLAGFSFEELEMENGVARKPLSLIVEAQKPCH